MWESLGKHIFILRNSKNNIQSNEFKRNDPFVSGDEGSVDEDSRHKQVSSQIPVTSLSVSYYNDVEGPFMT